MKRIIFIACIVIFAIIGSIALLRWSDSKKIPVIALLSYVSHPVLNTVVNEFKSEMNALGYREGETVKINELNAEGRNDQIEPLARTLLNTRPDIFVPVSTPVSRVVFNLAPKGQVVVYSFVTNPDDLEPGLSNHGGTGVSDAINYRKSVELIRMLLPSARRIGYVYNPTERNSQIALKEIQGIAIKTGLNLRIREITSANEIREGVRLLIPEIDAFFIGPDNTAVANAPLIIQLCNEAKKPVIAVDSGTVEAGALAAYSVDYKNVGKETARLVHRLLVNPGSVKERVVPVFNDDLILNEIAARHLHYQFPRSAIDQAQLIIR